MIHPKWDSWANRSWNAPRVSISKTDNTIKKKNKTTKQNKKPKSKQKKNLIIIELQNVIILTLFTSEFESQKYPHLPKHINIYTHTFPGPGTLGGAQQKTAFEEGERKGLGLLQPEPERTSLLCVPLVLSELLPTALREDKTIYLQLSARVRTKAELLLDSFPIY